MHSDFIVTDYYIACDLQFYLFSVIMRICLYDFRRLVIHYCSERHSKIWMFLKKLSPRLHLFDQKQYSKNNNIEKYYCLKYFLF